MQDINENRQNLYNNLLSDGYFRGGDGEVNFSFEDFCSSLDDRDNVETLYNNLIDDGYFRDEQGEINLNLEEFSAMTGNAREKLEYYPITENQRGLIADWEMNSNTTQYNIPDILYFDGVSSQQLCEAVIKVINAHPYLKTYFAKRDGDVVQMRNDDAEVVVTCCDIDFEPDQAFFQQRVRPFNLFEGPLYRAEVYAAPASTYLFLDVHHTIFDGASSLVFEADLQAALAGNDIAAEQYSAFDRALDESKFWNSDKCAEAEKYFEKKLPGVDSTVYPRSNNGTGDAIRQKLELDIPCAEIEEFCRTHQVTESNYFLTMLMQVLHRVTREEDVLVSTIHHGRTDMRMMETMGMFVKTQPVVSHLTKQIGKETSVAEAVADVQRQLLETQKYDVYSFTKLVERYGIHPEIIYVFQGGGTRKAEEKNNHISLELNTAKMPISFIVLPKGLDKYILRLEYDGSLYSKYDMIQMIEMLSVACQSAVKAKMLIDVALLSGEKMREVIELSKGKDLNVDIKKTIVEVITEHAKNTPDAVAVTDEKSQFTYGELDKRSNSLAHKLIETGVQPDDFVCIMLDRSKEFVLSVLGVHKAAAAYTPLDIDYPSDRLQYMMEDCQAHVLITTHMVMEEKCRKDNLPINEDRMKVLFLDDLNLEEESSPICLARPENLAYMIYTSGSTGKPKGTMLHQAGLMNAITVVVDEQKLTPADRAGVFYAFSFDAHIVSVYPALLAGGNIHIVPSNIRKDLESIVKFFKEKELTVCGLPTAIGSLIVQNYPDLPLRLISMGGERMDGLSSDKYDIINAYGPTECTCETTFFVIPAGKVYDIIPIGRPIANNWGFVTDMFGQLLPPGCAGEFCFAGIQVGRGYWKLPEKTAEVFVDCPFVNKDFYGRAVRMYHTGDMVRYREDGQLDFIGRIDNQVKLRGFRIELGEIENRAMSYTGIKQVAVLVKKIYDSEHLCMYYTAEDKVDETELKKHLSLCLAEYMIPDTYMLLDAMPMTPNGKINRRVLPIPEIAVAEIEMPADEMEAKLYEIAKKILKAGQFGVTTNLVSMGMNSLSAMRLSASIQQELNINVPTKCILQGPTIREIATMSAYPEELDTNIAVIHSPREFYPLTENQRGVYVNWEMNRNTTQYNIPMIKKMPGVDAYRLRSALIAVVEAHPYLKNRFTMHDEDVVQVRNEAEPAVVTVTLLDEEPSYDYFQRKVVPFDLLSERLYRLEVIKTPGSVYLFADIHHTIFDGGSRYVFLTELEKALAGESLEKEKYTAWDRALDEQEMMHSRKYEEAKAYFNQILGEAEVAIYPYSPESKPDGNKLAVLKTCIEL